MSWETEEKAVMFSLRAFQPNRQARKMLYILKCDQFCLTRTEQMQSRSDLNIEALQKPQIAALQLSRGTGGNFNLKLCPRKVRALTLGA